MGRNAEGYRLRRPRRPGATWTVRFRIDGRRCEHSTGERDRAAADREGRAIYAAALSGRRHGRAAPRVEEGAVSEWLSTASLREPTRKTYEEYAAPWIAAGLRLEASALATYARKRLREIKAKSLRSELSALRGLCRYMVDTGLLDELPAFPTVPSSATGTPSKVRRRTKAPELSAAEVRKVLRALPERSSRARFVVRDFYRLAYETGLRPSTLERLSVPEHWGRGETQLRITVDVDKEGFDREVPLTPEARRLLARCAPECGLIFGVRRRYPFVHAAAKAAGLSPVKAAVLTGQHFRSARTTHLLDAGAPLTGVQWLVGHKHASTTDKYVRPSMRAALVALKKAR
jgi:integrase